MKQMVFEFDATGNTEKIEILGRGIRRTKDHQIVTKVELKSFGVTITKSVPVGQNFELEPFGL